MNTQQKIEQLLQFYIAAEKLKTTMRHSWTSDSKRQESSAEHSWMMLLIALTLFEHLDDKIDQLKTLKMIIIHDLAEAVVGDIPAFEKSERKTNKYMLEKNGFKLLLKDLSPKINKELLNLWEEYERNETKEAQLAQAIDKMEGTLQHNIADIQTWDDGDYAIHPYYGDNLFNFDTFLRALRDRIEDISFEKIEKAGTLTRLDPEYIKKYKSGKQNKK